MGCAIYYMTLSFNTLIITILWYFVSVNKSKMFLYMYIGLCLVKAGKITLYMALSLAVPFVTLVNFGV